MVRRLIDTAVKPAPAVQRHVFGPEEVKEALRGFHFEVMQLGRATGPTIVQSIHMSGAKLDLLELGMPVHFQGVMPSGCYTLLFVERCPTLGTSMTFSKQYFDGHLGFFPPGIKAEALSPVGYKSAMLQVPVERFLAMVEIAHPEIPYDVLRDGIGLRMMPQDAKRIRGAVRAARAYFWGASR